MTETPTYNPKLIAAWYREHGRLVEKKLFGKLAPGDAWALKKVRERIERLESALFDGDESARVAADEAHAILRRECGNV